MAQMVMRNRLLQRHGSERRTAVRPPAQHAADAALIELFTWKAAAVARRPMPGWRARDSSSKAILLAWHVDYWNDLGWPDLLSQPAFSERAETAGRAFRRRGVYAAIHA